MVAESILLRKWIAYCLFMLLPYFAFSQLLLDNNNKTFDSIETSILSEKAVNKKLKLFFELSKNSSKVNSKQIEDYGQQALKLADSTHSLYGKAIGHLLLGLSFNANGNVYLAMENFQKSLEISETLKDSSIIVENLRGLFYIYWGIKDYPSALESVNKRLLYIQKPGLEEELSTCYNNYGLIYESLHQNDSAITMYCKAITIAEQIDNKIRLSIYYNNLGITYQSNLKKPKEALEYQKKALLVCNAANFESNRGYIQISIGRTLTDLDQLDSAKIYLLSGIAASKKAQAVYAIQEGYEALYKYFKKTKEYDQAAVFLELSEQLKDSLYNKEKLNALANLRLNYEIKKKEDQIEQKRIELKNKNRLIVNFMIVIAFGLMAGYLLYQSREEKKKINLALEAKNEELTQKNEEISTQKDMLEEQHEEIQTQATQLSQVNDEINRINESLEIKVAERTKELEEQNKKLLEYNFMNSHVLRSPVARLKGLFNLIEMERDLSKKLEYMDLFKQSVEDLDNFTKTVSAKLNEGQDNQKNF